ncbi:hypothetical protein [Vibrio owensii]|uniref:hypothetical protein n=1 Tax=Vibrio owensii TaxID=696485 RepID=UPI0038CDD79E
MSTTKKLQLEQLQKTSWLRSVMKRHKLNQHDVGEICSVTQQTVSYWMNAGTMKEKHVKRICDEFGEGIPKFSEVDPLLYDWHPITHEIVRDLIKDNHLLSYSDLNPTKREAIEKKLALILVNIQQLNDLIG